MLGLLLYLENLWFMPHIYIVVPFFYLLIYRNNLIKIDNKFYYYILWITFGLLVYIIGIFKNFTTNNILNQYPWFIITILTIIYSKTLKKSDLIVLLILINVEVFVSILEWLKNVPTFFFQVDYFYGSDLLYFKRPYGFSNNSSVVAENIFLGFLILDIIDIRKKFKVLFFVILLLGLIVTFNRTFILSIIIFYNLKLLCSKFPIKYKILYITFLIIISFTIFYKYYDIFIYQFTRDKNKLDLSGREEIWDYYLGFIKNNFVFGNYMNKIYYIDGKHAHNSFLQIIATDGILIAFLYFLIIFLNIRKENFIYVFTILFSGIAQYSFGWGVSLVDIILFYFLFYYKKIGTISKLI